MFPVHNCGKLHALAKARRRTVELVGMLHTRRLVGERLRPSDLGDLRGMHRDRGVMATLSADGEVGG